MQVPVVLSVREHREHYSSSAAVPTMTARTGNSVLTLGPGFFNPCRNAVTDAASASNTCKKSQNATHGPNCRTLS